MALPDSDTITARLRKVEQLIRLKREFVDPVRAQLLKQRTEASKSADSQPESKEKP